MPGYRYWRAYVTKTAGTGGVGPCAIAEMELLVASVDVATGGAAIASSDNGNGPANAFDDSNSSYWQGSTSTLPQWIGYDRGAGGEVWPDEISLTSRFVFPEYAPVDFTFQGSSDGAAWDDVSSVVGSTGWGTQSRRVFTLPGPPADPAPVARVTQLATLALEAGDGDARVTVAATLFLEGGEVLVGDARATQAAVLILTKEEVGAQVTQAAVLALVHETPCLQKLAQCWSIARTDGVTLRYTTHDEPVTLQGEVYAPCDSLRVSAQSGGVLSGGTVGDAGVRGLIVDGAITQRDILGGLYDGAVVEVWEQQWDPANETGFIPRRLARGIFGKITHGDVAYNAELVSPGARLMQRPLLRPHTPACRYDLGDGRCPVALGPLTVSGSVTATPARSALHRSEFRMFADSARAEATGYFADGRVTWTSGLNTGFSAEIRTNAAGVFTLWAPMPYKIAAGDAYTMTPGCNKTRDDHTVKFGLDMVDFGGFPDLPGNDAILQTPNAKA